MTGNLLGFSRGPYFPGLKAQSLYSRFHEAEASRSLRTWMLSPPRYPRSDGNLECKCDILFPIPNSLPFHSSAFQTYAPG